MTLTPLHIHTLDTSVIVLKFTLISEQLYPSEYKLGASDPLNPLCHGLLWYWLDLRIRGKSVLKTFHPK